MDLGLMIEERKLRVFRKAQYPRLLSPSDNLILDSAGVKRQVGQGNSTAQAAPTLFCPFQKIIVKLARLCTFFLAMERSGV
jgi:hypothetical protein